MPLRRRLSLVAATAVAVAILLAAMVCYLVVRNQLRGQVDSALRAQAVAVQQGDIHSLGARLPDIPASLGGPAPYDQFVAADGTILNPRGPIALPVSRRTRTIAAGNGGVALEDIHAGDEHLRMITVQAPTLQAIVSGQQESVAVELARPLGPTDRVLSHLRLILIVLCLGGIGLAAALGRLAARRVLVPLAEVARTAEYVSETEDLTSRIHVPHPDDEVGQLARRFNAMIERLQGSRAELDESVRAQRQLVADASHELRTPVTSLRTNVEVLLAGGQLETDQRERLMADVVEQTEELSALVDDLIELARGDLPLTETEDVRLDHVAAEALARARRNAPGIRFQADLHPSLVQGVPERLGRAIGNLLDNAARHSPAAGTVEVTVDADGLRVRDHGAGIDDADLPYVFDRFFRGVNSRGRQGSGLGLAIVRQVAEQHGGTVSAANAPGGGAVFVFALPAAGPSEPEHQDAGHVPDAPGEVRPPDTPAPVPGGRR